MATSFDHQERLRLSLPSPEKVIVELETISTLRCEANQCLSVVSPFRSDIRQLLHDFPSVQRVQWESSSQPTNTLTGMSRRSRPSGVSVKVELDGDKAVLIKLIQRLQSDRLLLAPMESAFSERLHRFILRNESSFLINLPMEGTAVSAEAMEAYLPKCGLWSTANAATWSNNLLGTEPGVVPSQRNLWMDFHKRCDDDGSSCTFMLKQGIQYGRRWNGSKLALNDLLPGSKFRKCPWTKGTPVEVVRPSSIAVIGDTIETEDIGSLRITTHALPSSLGAPFLQVQGSSQWEDVSFGRIDKTIHRPSGMAHTGSFETTVTNDDVYEAHVSLYDVLPSYIRPTSVELSFGVAARTDHREQDSTLVQHDFILPPHTSAQLTVIYDPILLPFQHFPPDPNRGIEVPPSWVVWNSTDIMYSQSLLLLPPVPDMSMPFNIISLTCTLYAFIIGSIINTLVRRAEEKIYYQLYPDKKPLSASQKLKEKLKMIKEKLIGKKKRLARIENTKDKMESKELLRELLDDDWIPEAKLDDDNSGVPLLLTSTQRENIAKTALPVAVAGRTWKRVYSLERDGDSFEAFLEKANKESSTVLVVKTTAGHVFGGYADQVWERHAGFFGAGQSCLFKVLDDDTTIVYKWTGSNLLMQHVNGENGRLAMGGGGGFGLCIEDNFSRGSTAKCETFDNDALCPDDMFQVLGFEVYGFVRGSF